MWHNLIYRSKTVCLFAFSEVTEQMDQTWASNCPKCTLHYRSDQSVCGVEGWRLTAVCIRCHHLQMWSGGKYCFRAVRTKRANALVCAIGSCMGAPLLFFGLRFMDGNMAVAWVFELFLHFHCNRSPLSNRTAKCSLGRFMRKERKVWLSSHSS